MGMKEIRTYLAARATGLEGEAKEHDRQAAIKRDQAAVYRWLDTLVLQVQQQTDEQAADPTDDTNRRRAEIREVFLGDARATPAFGSTRSPLPASDPQEGV